MESMCNDPTAKGSRPPRLAPRGGIPDLGSVEPDDYVYVHDARLSSGHGRRSACDEVTASSSWQNRSRVRYDGDDGFVVTENVRAHATATMAFASVDQGVGRRDHVQSI